MNIAILGGSFNPPHICHLFALQYMLAASDADQAWLLPCYQHAFGKTLAPFEHRFAMCQLVVSDFRDERVRALPLERDRQGTSWTIETARHIKRLHPDDELIWAIGSDVLFELDRWRAFEELQRLITFFVVPRAGFSASSSPASSASAISADAAATLQRLRQHAQELERQGMFLPNISSSLIRERIQQRQPIRHLVPASVAAYIDAHRLYS